MPAEPNKDQPEDLPELTDHGCFLLYTMRFPEQDFPPRLKLTLGDLLTPPDANDKDKTQALAWISDKVRETASENQRTKPVWEPAPLDVGTDLHPHIRRLLGEADDRSTPLHAQAYRLSDLARRLVQGEPLRLLEGATDQQRQPKILTMQFSKVALKRLEIRLGPRPPDRLLLRIEQVRLVIFRTGIGILIVEVSFRHLNEAPLHPYWLVEAVNSLARFNTLRWLKAADESQTDSSTKSFTLGNIVRTLSGESGLSEESHRVFTASYLQLAEPLAPAAAHRLAVQLSRHYTDDYRIAADLKGTQFVADFENVLHALSIEGSATVVDKGPPAGLTTPGFIDDFKSVTFRQHYLPLLVLAYHEFTVLLHLTNDSNLLPAAALQETGNLARLERLRDQILSFRLCYRFSYVSYISMHNALNRGLREVLGLDWMLQELDRDTAEIQAYLEQVSSKQTAARFRLLSALGAAGVAWLTTFASVDEILKVAHVCHDMIGPTAAIAGVVTGVVAGSVTWVRTGHGHGEGHAHGLAHHAIHDQIIHRVLKQ